MSAFRPPLARPLAWFVRTALCWSSLAIALVRTLANHLQIPVSSSIQRATVSPESRLGPTFQRKIWLGICLCYALITSTAIGQDLSWVNGAMERSKAVQRENLPAWRYDPRVAASNNDASLNALAVISADRLVAVGDRGLILASIDGGRTWQAQNSWTSLNLYGVAFFNEQEGVAVGGSVQPLSQTSVGIVLLTSDGGKNWQAISESSKAPLPRLTGVSIDQRALRAWGDYSSAHDTGVFESQDQGRSWQPTPSSLNHIQAIARQPHGVMLGVDRAGRLGQLPANPNRPLMPLASPQAPIESLIYTGREWLAVGDKGTLASSQDGSNWADHRLPLSQTARDVCAFRCAATQEEALWVAGSPGSILLNSPDSGRSWRVVPIDQAWSISAIRFFDRNRGWFVTSGGSIWATRNAGVTWFAQRVPVQRVGLQAIAAASNKISWPALASATWQSKQATELVTVIRDTPEDTVDFTADEPATLAALGTQVGLVSAILPAQWSSLQDSESRSSLINYLAMRLRANRPTAVLIDDVQSAETNNELFTETVSQAVWLAEHESKTTQWLTELNLAPWKVAKLMNTALSAEPTLRSRLKNY